MKFEDLYTIILDRKKRMPKDSYVALLFNDPDQMLQKIGEEATELVIAGKNESKTCILEEASDLLFHIFVLLAAKEITLEDIDEELKKRQNSKSQRIKEVFC